MFQTDMHSTTYQLKYIKTKVLPSIQKHPYSRPFKKPVDPVQLNVPVSLFMYLINIL